MILLHLNMNDFHYYRAVTSSEAIKVDSNEAVRSISIRKDLIKRKESVLF